MSIAQIARFSAAYASFAKLVLVSSRGTSRVELGRALPSGMPQIYGIPRPSASLFRAAAEFAAAGRHRRAAPSVPTCLLQSVGRHAISERSTTRFGSHLVARQSAGPPSVNTDS